MCQLAKKRSFNVPGKKSRGRASFLIEGEGGGLAQPIELDAEIPPKQKRKTASRRAPRRAQRNEAGYRFRSGSG